MQTRNWDWKEIALRLSGPFIKFMWGCGIVPETVSDYNPPHLWLEEDAYVRSVAQISTHLYN